jgi:peptidoglycan/LPS O-acetylase OafA/YrhL
MLWRAEKQTSSLGRSLGRWGRLSSLALVAVLIFLINWRPAIEVPLDPSGIKHDSGFASIVLTPTFWWGAYGFQPDDNLHQEQSGLILLENGRALGASHSTHDVIRQKGGGAYSHYNDQRYDFIVFSTSDNSDPLTNGRRYSISGRPSLQPFWRTAATAALLAIVLANLFVLARASGLFADGAIESRRTAASTYRADIDGLRAVAVTLVILFHLGVSWMPGGFLGVDVFFVISGYLITGIIWRQIETKTFSFVGFYQRRIKRIFPAMFVVVAATLAAGFVLLLPGDYAATAKSAIYTVSASSNFYFLFNTGYFDAAAELMPLLHTWSLGVEEQFYLAWPALMVGLAFAFGLDRRRAVIALVLVAFVSYVCGTLLVATDPKAAFYLPVTRAWEFVAGALLSHAALERVRISPVLATISGAIGLALVIGSALVITKEMPFPSWSMMLPVAGAALIVAPFHSHGPARALLASAPFVFVGRVSYSLYLWHWPIITLYRHYNLNRPISVTEALCLTAVMAVASVLSWRYVEEPFRRAPWPAWKSIGMGCATASALAAVSLIVIVSAGFPQRMPPSATMYESLEGMWAWDCPQEKVIVQFGSRKRVCVLGANWDTAKAHGILIGDSHAGHMAPLLDVAAREADIALLQPELSCMPLVGTTSLKRYFPEQPNYSRNCTDAFAPMLAYLHQQDDVHVIVLAAAWSAYPHEMYRRDGDARSRQIGIPLMLQGIKEMAASFPRKQFLIISDVPRRQAFDVGCLARSTLILRPACPDAMFVTPSTAAVLQEQVGTDAMIRSLPATIPNVTVSTPHDRMCGPDGCATVLNHEFIYRDAAHLRRNLTLETKLQLSHLLHLRQSLEQAAGLK